MQPSSTNLQHRKAGNGIRAAKSKNGRSERGGDKPQIFRISDPSLASKVRELIKEHDWQEKQKSEVINRLRTPYKKRLADFIAERKTQGPMTTVDVYGGVPPTISEQDWAIKNFLKEYFNEQEIKPCLMRGSIRSMIERHGRRNLINDTLKRWIRFCKITCLTREEYFSFIDSPPSQQVISRLRDRYVTHHLHEVRAYSYWEAEDEIVLIKGEFIEISRPQIEMIKKIWRIAEKIPHGIKIKRK